MRGFAQSFSLSVSCAAMLSHLSAVGALRPGSLGPEERARVLFKWSLDSVRAGRGILRKEVRQWRGWRGVGPGGDNMKSALWLKTHTRLNDPRRLL